MKVTSVRVRRIYGKGLYAIASVTIDGELTINDIKVYRKGADFTLRFPNSENAKQNNQFSILAEDSLYKEIKAAVLKQIDSYFYGEKGG
ncbi:septation protein SpoVG family protein [Ruminococcus sp.]|jgi:DNA-binding cell septation regulator SpoVG|uniref:septation protein SpoVG family protein n=1 Tax=Ruminococcus sp. TaxID=41978 RepID=UPI002E77EBE3|nr:septation protein SpoVG family protein [Ruminococcus sp.]MEE0874594.1 septation protein SpoVG family protein [Ruminococcus sp.]MEE0875250.1 septation protein SpoVG family protein [Ruminococcus sp.]MEE1262593.1 septation protein SpoVG family protein [Ruminococcus sp.]